MTISDTQIDLAAELQPYGVTRADFQSLRKAEDSNVLDYLDLVNLHGQEKLAPDAVVESQGRPLLFVVNQTRLAKAPEGNQLLELRRTLGCRGQRSYLAFLSPGEIHVFPVDITSRNPKPEIYRAGTIEASTFFARLSQGHYDGQGDRSRSNYVFDEMFKLLQQAAGALALSGSVSKPDVLSLVGRALFFRFLCDRKVVTEDDTRHIAIGAQDLFHCFDTPESAASTCSWLDKTFNGDFLPLTSQGTLSFFQNIGEVTNDQVFRHLGAIMRGYSAIGGSYQMRLLDWTDFDFAHVPVGLLSQVYEAFSRKWDPSALATSVHYTPYGIAATLVEEIFHKLPNGQHCRVLDPACGAGVFLVLAFRQLYKQRWDAMGERPQTSDIRQILNNQLTGFDISDSALRLSALSLYLTAIELDPNPTPLEKLRFKGLRQNVLWNFRQSDEPEKDPVIGSLGNHVNSQFDEQFDVVLSNPPWTRVSKEYKALADQFTEISRTIVEKRGGKVTADRYANLDSAPDMPFLLKATQWCKPNGRIAMALPSRILLRQGNAARYARKTLFELLDVTTIINCSNLNDTPVWPEVHQPFMLLFARNRKASAFQTIRFIAPHYDRALNGRGEMWIDAKSAQPVQISEVHEEPWFWKALTVGTPLDIQVLHKIVDRGGRPLRDYWKKDLKLASANGYQIAEKQEQRDASHLKDLPNLNSTEKFRFVVDTTKLDLFARKTACFPRERKVYSAPLVVVLESPPVARTSGGTSLISLSDVAYNSSFHGYSAAGHPDSEFLARYLHLFIHSNIWRFYALLTSPQFGAERQRFHKTDLDLCPIIPIDRLSIEHRAEVFNLSAQLVGGDPNAFLTIDEFFGELYGLDELDMEVIHDTLNIGWPYDEPRARASAPPLNSERKIFLQRLSAILNPFFAVWDKKPLIAELQIDSIANPIHSTYSLPYINFSVSDSIIPLFKDEESIAKEVLNIAQETGTSRLFIEIGGQLVVGILNQYRYWTPSRARLCATEIIRSHISIFEDQT